MLVAPRGSESELQAPVPPVGSESRSAAEPAQREADATDLSTVEISLERTTCFGWCPAYTVTIYGDGRVRYSGRRFVREIGEREGHVPVDTVRSLVQRFTAISFWELNDHYSYGDSDSPSARLVMRTGDRSKRVEKQDSRWYDSPCDSPPPDRAIQDALVDLTEEIDRAVGIEQWIGTPAEWKAWRPAATGQRTLGVR
jgi:hypothetical protein